MKVSVQLTAIVASETGRSIKETEKLLGTGLYGQTTHVPTSYVKVACGLLQQDRELKVTRGAQPAEDEVRNQEPLLETRTKRRRPGFCPSTVAHVASKEAANKLFLDSLRTHGTHTDSRVVVLDAFAMSTGFELRSLSALQHANFRNVFVVNPDEGICRAASAQAAFVFQGTWEEASVSWIEHSQCFAALYLDLCAGSVAYLERQLRLACSLADSNAVLAYTVLERDYDGFPLAQRLYRLNDLLLSHGWLPSLAGWEASCLAYRTGSGQQAVTQAWYRRGAP
jgi:hypothetical protein